MEPHIDAHDTPKGITARELLDLENEGFMTSAKTPWRLRCLSIRELQVLLRCAWQPLRIVITYCQVTSQLGAVLHINYPDAFASTMLEIKSWLDVFGYFFSLECAGLAGFTNKWVLRVVCLPLVLLSLAAGYYMLEQRLGVNLSVARAHLRGSCFFIVFFCYPSICNICFSAFNCLPLEESTMLTVKDKSRSVLLVDDGLLCDEVRLYQWLSGVVIAVFGCGIPTIFGVLLWRTAQTYTPSGTDERNTLHIAELAGQFDTSPLTVTHMLRELHMGSDYGFLMDAYKPVYLYWEVIEIARKLILVGFVVLVGAGSIWQIMISAMLCVSFLCTQVKYQPYKIEADNTFRMVTEAHVFITVLVAFVQRGKEASSSALDTLLIGSFIVCVPIAWVLTTVTKLLQASFHGVDAKAAFARFQLGLASDKDLELLAKHCKQTKVIVMSCPEWGTLSEDEAQGPYDQNVMEKCSELQQYGVLKLGFDRAGASTSDDRDAALWDCIFENPNNTSAFEPDLARRKQLVKETIWFAGYQSAAKAQVKLECQNFDGTLLVVCIRGGVITQVEHEEMERIMDEARSDAKLNQIECDIQLVKMSYADFLKYDNQSTIKSTSQLSASARAAKLFKTHAEQSESSDAEI